MKDFRQFLLRGNVIDLAIGIVIGAAFGAVVTAFVAAFLTPLVALMAGKATLSKLAFTVGSHPGTTFAYGEFLNSLIAFILIGASIFFFVMKPINALMVRHKTGEQVDSDVRACPECLSSIPIQARRCAYCGSAVWPA